MPLPDVVSGLLLSGRSGVQIPSGMPKSAAASRKRLAAFFALPICDEGIVLSEKYKSIFAAYNSGKKVFEISTSNAILLMALLLFLTKMFGFCRVQSMSNYI